MWNIYIHGAVDAFSTEEMQRFRQAVDFMSLLSYRLPIDSTNRETPSRRSVSPRTTIAGPEYSALSPTYQRMPQLVFVRGPRYSGSSLWWKSASASYRFARAAPLLLVIQAIHGPDFSLRVLVTASNEHQVVLCVEL